VLMNQLELDRQHELVAFLRSCRARLSPEQVGLPAGQRRRTPGLRRTEVALLSGVSPEWYTRLEQGRDIHVSVHVLESLARVLRLDANERTHLFLLALRQPPPVETFSPTPISPAFQQFLTQLGTIPACVVDPRSTVVAWNTAFCVVFGDYATLPERERNSIWKLFTLPTPQRNAEWKELAQAVLAQFRAEYGRFIEDPWWARQIAELSRISPEFRELWARHDLRSVPEGHKSIHHPLVGELTFDFRLLQAVDSEYLRLMIYTPRSHSGTAEKIERLLTAGVRHANSLYSSKEGKSV
jgi:transcriptional regulator with XRE-family HTH domain